jgi:uncharacterized protein DUF1835
MRVTEVAVLHVTNGASTARTLRQTSLGGPVLAWDDVLYEGPVPPVTPKELNDLRARFLSGAGWGAIREIRASLDTRDRSLMQALADRPVVLWFEHDLYDQLQLLQILALAARTPAQLELINLGSFAGRPEFPWRAESGRARDALAASPDGRRRGDGDGARRLEKPSERRSPPPSSVSSKATARRFRSSPSPLTRLLEELPATDTGMSRTERQVLEALADGSGTPMAIFLGCQQREEAPFDGDAWAWRRLAVLASGARPLVAPADGGELPAPPPLGDGRAFLATTLVLTEAGRAVLEGRADRVEVLGLDRWLGGTHLRPGNDWRWDMSRRAVLGPA